ncbi:hypothetical protein ACFE04_022091 [Oxalis oulophora]
MDRLPRELKLLIFEKMPIKSLGLSMCVAKSWRSMIKNTSFVLSYSTVNRNVSRNELLIFQPSDDFLEVCLDEVGFGLYKQFDIPLASDGGEVLMNGMNGDLFVQESYDHEAPGPFPRSTQFIYSVDVGTALSEVLTIRNFRLQTRIVCYFEESLVLLDNTLAETVYINVFRPCV